MTPRTPARGAGPTVSGGHRVTDAQLGELAARVEAGRTVAHYALLAEVDRDAALKAVSGLLAAVALVLRVVGEDQ